MKKLINIMNVLCKYMPVILVTAIAAIASLFTAYFAWGIENFILINTVTVYGMIAVAWGAAGIISTLLIDRIPTPEDIQAEE